MGTTHNLDIYSHTPFNFKFLSWKPTTCTYYLLFWKKIYKKKACSTTSLSMQTSSKAIYTAFAAQPRFMQYGVQVFYGKTACKSAYAAIGWLYR